jgi:hypothetical protein
MRNPKPTAADKAEFKARLLELLKPGDTVYTVCRFVSASGMTLTMDLYVIRDNEPRRLTYWAAVVLGVRYNYKKEVMVVSGAGMDMGWHTVHSLSRLLFPDGFTDEQGEKRNDGGHALNHRWL